MNLETASSSSGPSVPQQPNLPRSDLLADESREDYLEICCGFQTASDKGDWKAAEAILEQKPELIRYAFTHNFDTPLHIAAMANSTKSIEKFVEKLVNLMDVEDLELHNKNYQTALSIAASTGNIKIAKIMLKKNKSLLEIPNGEGMMPLHVAAMYTNTNMVRYLYDKSKKMTTDSWRLENRGWVLQTCVKADHFDVALQIVNDHPELISNKRLLGDLLLCLASNTNALKGNKPNIISRIVKSMSHAECESDHDALKLLRILKEKMVRMRENDFNEILKEPPFEIEKGQQKKTTYPSRLLFVALEHGNTRFILELIRLYPLHPELILMVDDKGRSIFHIAVKYRKADIYNLLYQIGSMKESIICMKDVKGNNLLHFSAKLGKPKEFVYMPGAPIQMQQELLWFKDVEQMMPYAYREETNKYGETPHDLFNMKQHHLAIKCEKWAKETTKRDLVVGTILAFASAFTLGYYNRYQNIHLPMFNQRPTHNLIVIASFTSLQSSSTLALISLNYTRPHFLESLPKKRMLVLATMFLSFVTLMVAVNAFLFLFYSERQKWIPIMFSGFVGIIILLCGVLLYLALGSGYLLKPKKRSMS